MTIDEQKRALEPDGRSLDETTAAWMVDAAADGWKIVNTLWAPT